MLAIILEKNEEYVSPVFAIRQAGWLSEVLAFDRERKHIKRIRIWYPRRQVFIVQWRDFEYKRGNWEGFGWVLHDKKLWKALRFGRKADLNDFPQFGEYAGEIILPEWFEIETEDDINSLMGVSMDFHDSFLMRLDNGGNDICIQFDTTWGCIITVKFLGVHASGMIDRIGIIYDSVITKTADGFLWKVTDFDSGEAGGIVDLLPVSGEPYIACDRILWGIELGKSKFCAGQRTYNGLDDFYRELKAVSPNVFLKDDKLILHHKDDVLVIEQGENGYKTYFNGKRKRGEWEEQHIAEYAEDFLTQLNPEDIKEEVLADVTSVKALYMWHYLKYTLFFAVIWVALGLFLVFAAHMAWALFAIIFATLALYLLFAAIVPALREKEKRYIITSAKIYYFCGGVLNDSLDIPRIKDIKLYRSLIKKGVGTIKVRQRGCLVFGYNLIAVDRADEVYKLLRAGSAD